MLRCLLRALALIGASSAASVSAVAPDTADPVQATLVAESRALTPGGSVRLGLRLQHAPHWHTYWRNPGDSGLPTRLRFTLPAGYSVEDIVWPAPTRFDVGGLYNFGYTGDMLLPVRLHVPAGAKPGDTVSISAEASWLMCSDACIPGKGHVSVDLPVRTQPAESDRTFTDLFAHATAAQPQEAKWQATARVSGDSVVVTAIGSTVPRREGLDAFVEERKLVGYAPPIVSSTDDGIQLVFTKSEYLSNVPSQLNLVLMSSTGVRKAWHVTAPINPP